MIDILINSEGDIEFTNGDLNTGFSDYQHQEHILIANKGEYKEFPALGVGLEGMLDDDEITGFLIEVKKNLEYDGMKINNVKFNENGNLDIDGYYK